MIILGVFLLIFLSNYLIFTATRSVTSTLQGYNEIKYLNQEGNYIANLSIDSDMGILDKDDTQKVYDYLNDNLNYALFTDGFTIPVPNTYDMEVSVAYINEEYYNLNKQFEISQGENLVFDYSFDGDIEIPVLIGKGLSETYPLGSTFNIEDPVLEKTITLKVQGILKQDIYHSNLYAISSKQYYNFSVILPITEEFIANSNIGLHLNGLFDIILVQTSKDKIEELSEVIQDNLGLDFKFNTQQENFEFFNQYYFSSLKTIGVITIIVVIILTCLSVWSSLVGIRLMIKDFTINLFVGLSYSRLKQIFYGYYGILFLINLVALFATTAYSRYGFWARKELFFATFGFLGLAEIDWVALLAVLFFDIIIGIIIVEVVIWRIKKVPISLGVLQ